MAKRWTLEDIQFLQDNYCKGILYCATALGRSEQSIKTKAHRLNIRSGNYWITNRDHINALDSKAISYRPIDNYINAKTPIGYTCEKGHVWKATPDNILRGKGCPYCSIHKLSDPNIPAMVYYVLIKTYNESYYKIGVTTRSLEKRFQLDKDKEILLLKKWDFNNSEEAYLFEKELLLKYNSSRIHVKNFLGSGGNTELFETNILGVPF